MQVCDEIVYRSIQMGFTSYNWYGSNSTKNNILIAASGQNARNAITFYIGHGSPGSYLILDDIGTPVWHHEIYGVTGNQINKFVFLWSCHQAEVKNRMPRGWLHTTAVSDDGYHNPDYGRLTFIGFKNYAPFLSINIDGMDQAGAVFIKHFYQVLAVGTDSCVNEALNIASFSLWERVWDQCALYNSTYGMWVYGNGLMSVYGLPG
ncbi:MAG: hypothetical protein RMJ07_06345 [Nitrososphaerota archaeon]|nr:hypothetical protein [Candidatus Bathyarchaeota archaeon]MDW8049276.1 hypothetical protein [Nitrososphaerota archaeon]